MKKFISTIIILSLTACVTIPPPEQMRSKWAGGDDQTFVKTYADCRMKADEKQGGVGTTAMIMLIWPVGLAMGLSGVADAENTMKLCMAGNGWSPAGK